LNPPIDSVEEINLVGPISADMLRNLPRATAIGRLTLAAKTPAPHSLSSPGEKTAQVRASCLFALANERTGKFTEAIARGLIGIQSLARLWLWLDATPAALRHVFAIPQLRVLDLMGIAYPGRLAGFAQARIEQFRCNSGLRESDLLEIAASTSIQVLSAHQSDLSMRAMTALITTPRLQSLDIEGTGFDDEMATLLVNNTSIRSLDVGMTRLSRKGLACLCTMKSLRSLDLWATRITQDDLELLVGLPLEYLSIGCADDEKPPFFSTEVVMRKLEALPALQRIWLDGLELNAEQLAEFKRRKIAVQL
jgi:hypothetical protein